MHRWTLGLTAGTAFLMILTVPTATQAIARRERLLRRAAPTPAASYHVSLRSVWPQDSSPGAACRNGGDEMVRGMVTRNAEGLYEGTLDRSTLLLFCGAHGASGEPCRLALEGDGGVTVLGIVVPDPVSPSGALRLSWTPAAGHAARVEGACSEEFKHSIRDMYLSARHGVEFPLPGAGAVLRQRLENYAWEVEVQ
jgi:hypothetical protein